MIDQNPKELDSEYSGMGFASTGVHELRVISNIFWAIRRSILWILLIAFVAAVVSYLLTYRADTKYTSSAKVMIETRVQTETQLSPEVSGLPLSLTSLESELQLLRSTDLIENVVDRLQLQNDPGFSEEDSGVTFSPVALARQTKNIAVDYFKKWNESVGEIEVSQNESSQSEEELARESAIRALRNSRKIEQVGDTSAVYQISVTAKTPKKAAEIANALATEYLSTLTKMKRQDLLQSEQWLTTRIRRLTEDLNKLSSELEAHSIEAPYSRDEYATIRAQRIKAERRFRLLSDNLARVLEQTNTIQKLMESGDFDAAKTIAEKSGLLQRELVQTANPEVVELELEAALQASSEEMVLLREQVTALSENIETFKKQQAKQGQHESISKRIENEILVTEAIYRDFVSQLGRRAERGDYLDSGAHIIERARIEIKPSEPKRSLSALTTMIAVTFLGLTWTIFRELFQNKLRTTFEFESTTGIRLSTIVPESKTKQIFESFFAEDGKIDPQLEYFGKKLLASRDVGLRSFRQDGEPLTTFSSEFYSQKRDVRLSQHLHNEDCAIFAGVSALKNEGKTSSLLIFGSACALAGFRTLIVDCDTVNSSYGHMSRLTSETLKHSAARPLRFVDYVVSTPRDRLDVLPLAGTMDSDELPKNLVEEFLVSSSFLNLVYSLSDLYEVILLDTPPLLSAVESAYFSQISQRVILFTRWNKTSKNSVHRAMRELKNSGVNPSVLVATRVDTKKAKLYGDPTLF